MASRVRILFVDGGREHANRAEEELAVFGGSLFQLLDVFLDVAGHVVERLGELADFGGAANSHAFVEFRAADGADRFHETANRSA